MILLAIETSSFDGGIALIDVEKQRPVAAIEFSSKVNHSRKLLDSIDFALNKSEMKLDDIGAVAVSVGPGSFTGVRIGLTHAKMLAWTRRIPLIGVGALDGLACRQQDAEIISALIPARGGEVFAGLYKSLNGKIAAAIAPFCAPVGEALDRIAQTAGNASPILFCGPGVDRHYGEIIKRFHQAEIAAPWHRYASPVAIGLVAIESLNSGKFDDPVKLEPLYFRPEHEEFKMAPPNISV